MVWLRLTSASLSMSRKNPCSRSHVTNNTHIAYNIMQEQQQSQYRPPSPPINFGMPAQLNTPNTARQLSQATMHFDGLQLDHQFPRRSSMLGQLNLVSPHRSPLLNALANAPLAHNQHSTHICTCPPIAPSPPQAFPLQANNPVANNVYPLPLSPPAQFISSANGFLRQLFHPQPPQKRYQPQNFLPITHAAPAPPDPNFWRFPSVVPSNAVPLVGTSVNLNTVQPVPLSNPHVPTSLRSSFHVQAAARSQNRCYSDHSANIWSYHSEPVVLGVTHRIPHLRLLIWTPRI